MQIELRHLRMVAEIADAGSISRAAHVLGSTQPALTRQLARLEVAFGGALFERTPHGVVPTALGVRVLARARSVLPVVDSLLNDAGPGGGHGGPAVQHVRLASPIGPTLVALLEAVRSSLPGARVTTDSESGVIVLRDMVAAGRLDAAVVHENPGYELELPPHVVRLVIRVEPVFVMVGGGHRFADRQEIELADLAGDDWVLEPEDGDRTHEYIAEACRRAGFAVRLSHQLGGEPATELVRLADHVTLVYAMARPREDLAIVPLAGAPLRYRQVLLVDRRSTFAPFAEEVVGRLRTELARAAREHPVLGPWSARNGPLTYPGTGRP